jgi:hypothetical protein
MEGQVALYFVGHNRVDALFGRMYDAASNAQQRAILEGKKVFSVDVLVDTDEFEEE